MSYQHTDVDSTTPTSGTYDFSSNEYRGVTRNDQKEAPTVNSTNPNYHSTNNNSWEKINPVIESTIEKGKGEFKKTQHQAEDIVTKTKKLVKQNWEQTCQAVSQLQKKLAEMAPKQGANLIYWRNPIQSGIVFGLTLAIIITFMFLSSLAAISFWLLALLIIVGLHKLYNYVMITFVGRVQDDIFDSIFPPDVHVSERQAQALANNIRVNGTTILKQARNLFLWNNLSHSVLFGLTLFVFFYIGLSMNALTFALIGLIFLFTVPKIYQVYQVPIDRVAKQALDQINQLLAKVTSKLPNKAKKA